MADQQNESGENINSQRAKIDEYRKWMQQQQKTLETTGSGTNEIARRMEQQSNHSSARHTNDDSQMSTYMRRNLGRKSASPLSHGRKYGDARSPSGGQEQQQQQGYYDQQYQSQQHGGGAGGSPRNMNGEKPAWINTKVGSTNTKSAIPPEQLAKFNPPPPSDDGGYQNDPLNVFSRSTLWQKRKHQKLAEARDLKEQVMDMECTFSPATHTDQFYSHSRERSREPSVLSGNKEAYGGFNVTGVQEFVSRQQKSRDERAFREQRLKTRPQFAWKNETTVPEPFDLGRRRDSRIKALKQPFTAAPGAVQQAMRGVPLSSSTLSGGRNNMFAQVEGVMPRGLFSGVSAGEIVDFATLRSGGGESPASDRH